MFLKILSNKLFSFLWNPMKQFYGTLQMENKNIENTEYKEMKYQLTGWIQVVLHNVHAST